MLSFFFYGTLMDPDLQAVVLGGRLPAGIPAVLAGYRRRTVAGQDFPAIMPAEGSSVSGLLVDGIGPAMAARASFYEGEQYTGAPVTAARDNGTDITAWTFLPTLGLHPGTGSWDLARWQRRHKARTLRFARGAMARATVGDLRRIEAAWQALLRRKISPLP